MIDLNTKQIVEKYPIAFATISQDFRPNVIAVLYAKVISDNQIIITDNFMATTKDNILKNKNVCLAVWNEKEEGYKITGEAQYYDHGDYLKYVKEMPENEGLPAKGAIVVTISNIHKLG